MARPASPSFIDRLSNTALGTWIVVLCAVALYANTLGHGYVLDDGLVLSDNAYVLKGIRGIPDILAHDSFHGTLGESENLSGGRYRPLSLVMFACETSFFGPGPFSHHVINVLLYAVTALVLLRLLRSAIFPSYPLAAFCATLLFIVHPLHTEVVANIKSRDEILSLLFLLLTLHYLLRGASSDERSTAPWKAAGCYALALLSKENGVILLGIAPLALFTFTGSSWARAFRVCWPLGVVAVAYMALRLTLLGTSVHEVPGVLDNPYVLATTGQKLATIVFVLLRDVGLLLWPHPLTYDYSFAQVPYRDFSDPLVWTAVVVLSVLAGVAVRSLVRRDPLGWCAAFFLATWVLVSGLFFNIGAPMAERFLYQASVPFLVAVVEIARRALALPLFASARITPITSALVGLLCIPQIWSTLHRNADWRDGNELLVHDAGISTRSARANTYAGIACIRMEPTAPDKQLQRDLCLRALDYFDRADSIVPDYLPTLLNRGVAHYHLDSIALAEISWDRARTIEPDNKMLKGYEEQLYQDYYRKGLKAGTEHDLTAAISHLNKAVRYGPAKPDAWYNLGGAYFTTGDTANARTCWERTLRLDPQYAPAQQGLAALGR